MHYDDQREELHKVLKTTGSNAVVAVCKKTMPFEWEQIDSSHQRVKVFGGWLVKAHEDVCHLDTESHRREGWDWRIAIAFVPDPLHQWQIGETA